MKELHLDGNDWEADYFISVDQYQSWRKNPRNQDNQLMECAQSSGFIRRDCRLPDLMRGTIPGCDRTFLLENGRIDDPYFGRNLDYSRWAEDYAWAFRKSFSVSEDWKPMDRIQLHFKGIDYKALFFLNGKYIGDHEGMFIPAIFDVTDFLDFELENLLAVVFFPAPKASPNHHDRTPADFSELHRTQMSFGWDWSRRFVTTGIWDHVILRGYKTARIADCGVFTEGNRVALVLDIESQADTVQSLMVKLSPVDFDAPVVTEEFKLELNAGVSRKELSFDAGDIRFWYPNLYGEQPLYDLKLRLGDSDKHFRIGFRSLEMKRNFHSPEGAYDLTFCINGQKIFARGLNWVPADLMFARNDEAGYGHLVRLAAEAGFNLFRVWGGGMVEKEAFYNACDQYGIMVWQEFMHACSNYRKDPEYTAKKRQEGEAIIRKLRNHVSLSLFCGGNEMQYYGESPASPVLQQYGELVRILAPQIPYHISCPDLSRPGERNHGPWHFQEHKAYNEHFRLLASELGCNGMPEYDSLQRFIPHSELKELYGQSLNFHFFNTDEQKDIRLPLRKFNVSNAPEFCQASMFAQADAVAYAMEHYRRLYPRASGLFFWQYNEPWPTCSYSLVDYYGMPKMALYVLRRANTPVLLSLQDDSWCVEDFRLRAKWFLTCDKPFSGALKLTIMDIHGNILHDSEVSGAWEAGTVELSIIDKADIPSGIIAAFLYLNNECRSVRLYGSPDFGNAFDLPESQVIASRKKGSVLLRNTGKNVAVNIRLHFPDLPSCKQYFSDNYLTIEPGGCRIVETETEADSTPLKITGWNCKEAHYDADNTDTLSSQQNRKQDQSLGMPRLEDA